MVNDHERTKFYDRIDERKKILDQIFAHSGQRQIIILVGTSGVGKSSLAEKLLRDELRDYKSVTLAMGKSSVNTIENLSYFDTLYRKLNDLAKERKEFRIKTVRQYGCRNFIYWLQFVWSALKSYLGIDPEIHIYEPTEEPRISSKKQYILSVLKKGAFIINVQNIHNIDTQSAELFKSISKSVPDLIWLVEYTVYEENYEPLYTFCNEWKCVAEPSLYTIKKLDFDLAFNLAPPEVRNPQQRKRIEAQYEKSHGNLLTIMVVPKNLDEDGDYIQVKLMSLSQDEKYIVYILYLNETPVPESMLYAILARADEDRQQISFSQNKVMILLDKLEKENIIKKQDRTYSIKHDTLISVLSQIEIVPSYFLAFKALEIYYQEMLERRIWEQTEPINHLFSLYARFHDEKLIDLLPKLWNMILSAKYPKDIIEKIDLYKCHLLKHSGTDFHILYPVVRFLAQACIHLQYFDQAQENLDLMYALKPSQYVTGLQGAVYSLRSTPENWDKLNSIITKAADNSRLKLSLCLCRLRMMMRSCNSSEPQAYAEELLSCSFYKEYPEYGFLLHNYAEFAVTPDEALNCYNQALDIFKKYSMVSMQAETLISMSMSYAYAGQLKTANKCLQKAAMLSPGWIPETVLLNNSAVIEILDGRSCASVLSKLADAALMDINPYELIIIKSNWLVGAVLTNHMDQAADLVDEIEKSSYEDYQYEDFLHIVYQDLYFYYTKVSNNEKVRYYQSKLLSLTERNGINEGTRELIHRILNRKPSANIFYSQFPFRVDFLGFWGLVISPDLENFQ